MTSRGVIWAVILLLASASSVLSQTNDHLECFRIDDPLATKATVSVDVERVGVHLGCKVSASKFLCTPASKQVVTSALPVMPVGGPALDHERICYKLKCAERPTVGGASDQWGMHPFADHRPKLLCTPAVVGPPVATETALDHLVCYAAKGGLRPKAQVVLDAPALGQTSTCTAKKAKLHCVSASAMVLMHDGDALLDIGGAGVDGDRVCYPIDCAKPYPPDQTVADRFGGRTLSKLRPGMLCTPAVGETSATTTTSTSTSTIITVPGSSTTSTSLPMPTDPVLLCQRAIQTSGMTYADAVLDRIETCGQTGPISTCLAGGAAQGALASVRATWGQAAAPACQGVDVFHDLGYLTTCDATPSTCTFSFAALDVAGTRNDLLDCLACKVQEHLGEASERAYNNEAPGNACQAAIAGGVQTLRAQLDDVGTCLQQPGAVSLAACFPSGLDDAAWRASAVTTCGTTNPFTQLGYPTLCAGVAPISPASCPLHGYPCTFPEMATLNAQPAQEDDLLDCLTCQLEEGLLGVGRTLFGANLCCIGGACDTVRTRFSCRAMGGVPVHYRMGTVDAAVSSPHGIDVADDGTLYIADSGGARVVKVAPGGAVSVVGNTPSFPTGVAADAAGNVYVTNRCSNQVRKITPSGVVSVFAGTGVRGHSGDGGPAVAAQTNAPDGIAVDGAGNVYFTESGLLGIVCGGFVATERVRVVRPNGIIDTLIGPPGGGDPIEQTLGIPYGLHFGFDGTLIVGEAFSQRAFAVDLAGPTITHVAGRLLGAVGSFSGNGGPALRGRFYENCGSDGDLDGNLLISSMDDNHVTLVDRLGSMTVIAGTGEGSFGLTGDGQPGVLAEVGCPEDLAVGPDGTVYFASLFNNRVRTLKREQFP